MTVREIKTRTGHQTATRWIFAYRALRSTQLHLVSSPYHTYATQMNQDTSVRSLGENAEWSIPGTLRTGNSLCSMVSSVLAMSSQHATRQAADVLRHEQAVRCQVLRCHDRRFPHPQVLITIETTQEHGDPVSLTEKSLLVSSEVLEQRCQGSEGAPTFLCRNILAHEPEAGCPWRLF